MVTKKSLISEKFLAYQTHHDDNIFSELYEILKPTLRRFISKYLKDPMDIDLIVTDTCLDIYKYPNSYDPTWSILTWIYNIAKIKSKRYYHSQILYRHNIIYLDDIDSVMENIPIYNIVDTINPGDIPNWNIFIDRYYYGLSYDELSNKYNYTKGTLMTKMSTTKKIIKKVYET